MGRDAVEAAAAALVAQMCDIESDWCRVVVSHRKVTDRRHHYRVYANGTVYHFNVTTDAA